MLDKLRCWLGIHDSEVVDWDAFEGNIRCKRCGHIEPMRGAALAEWIRYRTRRYFSQE